MLKKGVSPLIATVLLVMIVVSIGAAVMVVIQGLTDEQIKNIETQQDVLACGSDVKINLFKSDSKYRVCIGSNDSESGIIGLLMENAGQKDIIGFRVVALGEEGFNSSIYDDSSLSKGSLSGFYFKIGNAGNASQDEVTKIQIQPRIQGKETVTCQYPPLEFDNEFISSLENCADVSWDAKIVTQAATG